jgi:hypothetical protein
MSKPKLLVAPCSYQAAKYAVEKWHYSNNLSASKNNFYGIWENDLFVGCVVFGRGANNNIGKPYGLDQISICELTRVALSNSHNTSTSKIVSLALKQFKKYYTSMRLIVSYADANQGHIGIIYQAMNWVYTGRAQSTPLVLLNGRWVHARQAGSVNGSVVGLCKKAQLDKYRYLYPLDRAMRKQIAPLAKPYPKREVNHASD